MFHENRVENMKKFSTFVLTAFLLFVSNFLFVTPNANAQTTSPIIYGKTYYLQNGYFNWTGGGYLDTNSSGCEGNKYCVSTANTPNRANVETGTWKILSASGKSNGTPVLISDNIHLQNLYLGNGGYLDTNGPGCEGNKYCVSTANTPNRANENTGTWKILSSNKQNGTSLLVNDDIYLQNLYSGDGGYLDIKSLGCEGNLGCVSTSVSKERVPGSGTNHWRLIARNPEPNPIPTPTPINDKGIIDFTTETNKTYKVQITVDIPANVGYDNTFGIFKINDDGSVAGVKPGSAEYAATVVKNRIPLADVDKGSYTKGQTFKYDLPGGSKYGVFLIANGTPTQFLETNSGNNGSNPPLAYFFDTAASPDQQSHVKVLSPGQYGFEDIYGGGDQDFDDLSVKLETLSS
jgi:hypothetical protein